MNQPLTVFSERVDDIPLLLKQMEHMNLQPLLDAHFPTHHHWQGLSLGSVTAVWLSHILSQADHRLCYVEEWAACHRQTLEHCLKSAVEPLEFSDDRLGRILELLSNDEQWRAFESALNGTLLRSYDLDPQVVRHDATTASGYHMLTPDGLLQLGHSKDHRPDLPQLKVMLTTLDPLGMPLATEVVAGNRADDQLYRPMIARVHASVGATPGLLHVGDSKMAALATRAFVQSCGDAYLCPLPERQVSVELLATYLAPVWTGKQPLTTVYQTDDDGSKQQIAEGYECQVSLQAVVDGQPLKWTERRLILRSLGLAQRQEQSLRKRLANAAEALAALNQHRQGKKRLTDLNAMQTAVARILRQYQVEGLLMIHYNETVTEHSLRRYGKRAAGMRLERVIAVESRFNDAAITETVRQLGWRVYATNAPDAGLSFEQAVHAYRSEYVIEHGFHRLKGQPLLLRPQYLQRDDHLLGLVRLLVICLRVLTVFEYTVRRRLERQQTTLAGLSAGNPTRATARPTTEQLLRAFRNITLTVIATPNGQQRYLTALTPLQKRVLALLDFPVELYTGFCDFQKPT
jgi:transposase